MTWPWSFAGRARALVRLVRPAPGRGAAVCGLILLAAAGAVFAPRLAPDRYDTAPAPALRIEAELPGLGVAAVDRELTRPLEQALADVPGLRSIEARSRACAAVLLLRFTTGAARRAALPDLRVLVQGVAHAAGSVQPPAIVPLAAGAAPAVVYAFRVPELSEAQLRWVDGFADEVRALAGVSRVTVVGAPVSEVVVRPDAGRLATLGLDYEDLIAALGGQREAPRERARLAPASVEAVAAGAVRLPHGEPIALAEVAEIRVVERPPVPPSGQASLRMTVHAGSAAAAAQVAERVHDHLAWLEANDLVPAAIAPTVRHDEARAMAGWRTRVLVRLGVCVAVVLAFLGLVFGFRCASLAALGFAVWLPASLAALWLLGFTLNLPAAAGVLVACVPFALLLALPRAGVDYLLALAAVALLWGLSRALGGPVALAAGALVVAVLLAGPVRWLLSPWLSAGASRQAQFWTNGIGKLPARIRAVAAAVLVVAAAGASLYALPGVRAEATAGGFRLRLQGEDARRLAESAGSLVPGLHAIPRVTEVQSTAALVERWRLRLDPQRMRARGIRLAAVGRAFAIANQGLVVGEIVTGEARLPLRLRLAPGAAGSAFERLLLRGRRADQPALYLEDIGTADSVPRPRARLHIDGQPAVEIRAHWEGRDARAALLRYCRRLELPEDAEADCRVIDAPGRG